VGSNPYTLERMRKRVVQLSDNFIQYLEFFESSGTFIGPSFYFHQKTLTTRRKYGTVMEVLQDEFFFDWLYATLTAWGLHRMGQGNTKLDDIEELKRSFRSQIGGIQRIEHFRIIDLDETEVPKIAQELWCILSHLKVSIAEAQIVANSKALHHLLPSLVPPIDRTYTYNFFYDRNMLSISESEAFQEMFVQFHRIATVNVEQIRGSVGRGWNTSETKVIDNAIVGYVLKELRSVAGE
jgi:hypothetical protein